MESFERSRVFWLVMAAVVYPLLLAGLIGVALLPPLNLVLVPIWLSVSLGVIGAVSNGLAETKKRAERSTARSLASQDEVVAELRLDDVADLTRA